MKTFMSFVGAMSVVATCIVWIYSTFAPSASVAQQNSSLEKKIDDSVYTLKAEMESRRAQRDVELKSIRQDFQANIDRVLQKLDKMDDRLYDIQRHKDESTSQADWRYGDGS